MIYTLEHGVRSTPQDKFFTSLKYAVSGAVVGIFALFVGNLWYAHYYVAPSSGNSGHTVHTKPVALTISDGNSSTNMTGTSTPTTTQSASTNETMQYGQAGYSSPPVVTPATPPDSSSPVTTDPIPSTVDVSVTTDPTNSTDGAGSGTTDQGNPSTGTTAPTGTGSGPSDPTGVAITVPVAGTGATLDSSGATVTTPTGSVSL